ncbi:hypothetical protein QAD02_018489 [Eretmocerus hayati]|uniref:Uncharacterized protein n=1 Tax=Eretmocerus hayati TaxID=131215 RepID=A0ACC2PGU1_9HYME|nr:hypothetical protein QAD02_018489 [Eretmocerus hayati]
MAGSENENKQLPKFDPPIKSRFLPGETDARRVRDDLRNYKKHRLRCANAKPKVDNKAPPFEIDTYYNPDKLHRGGKTALDNYMRNLKIARKLNFVARDGSTIDCWNFVDKHLKSDVLKLKKENERVERANEKLYKKVHSLPISELSPQVMAKQWKILKATIIERSRFPWFKDLPKYPSISKFATITSDQETSPRTRCFFDLEFARSKLPLGRLVFELYSDFAPLTCANFEAFCKGYNGLSYRGSPLHSIVSGYWCRGGDVSKFNGSGGASIYSNDNGDNDKNGKSLNVLSTTEENLTLQHSCPGVLSTYEDVESKNPSRFDSKFNLSFRPLHTMDGKKLVFGKLINGSQTLCKIEAYGTKFGKPLQNIVVSNCGILERRRTKTCEGRKAKLARS